MEKYVIGCDEAGVQLKNELKKVLLDSGFEVEDCGVNQEDEAVLYPNIAKEVCERIIASNYEKKGLLVCGTGLGMCMSANKFPGIRAGVCHDSFSAERLALSNDGNVICFGQRVIGIQLAKKVLKEFIALHFVDGSSTPKVNAIKEIEKQYTGKISHAEKSCGC